MEKELMNKEVLCILDTRQIQKFMFKSNSYLDTLGGSDLVGEIQENSIRYAMTHIEPPLKEEEYSLSLDADKDIPYFVSDKIKFQLLTCSAGNAMCLCRTGELCQKIIRKISRYYLDGAYSLNLVASVTEKTDNFGRDIFHLYKKLNAIKASCDISDPMGAPPLVIREERTGLPAIAQDPKSGEYYSRASQLRREAALQRRLIVDMKDMQSTRGFDGKEYLAVIHADGNNLGITIGRILQSFPGYIKGTKARRQISKNIDMIYQFLMDKIQSQLKEYYNKLDIPGKKDFHYAFHVCHQGGDDINIICDARLAIPFINFLFENLKGLTLWDSDSLTIPLYMCAGIAYVVKDQNFHSAYQLAAECCDNAKKFAKKEENLRNGLAGNWIDFQVCNKANSQELDLQRQKTYITKEQINMQMRPYCLDPEVKDQPFSYYGFLERVGCLKKLNLTHQQQEALRLSYMMGRLEFRRWIQVNQNNGLDLPALLGDPLYRDKEDNLYALWFDAAEMTDFIIE